MKKLYLSASLLLIGYISHAQIEKGTVLLGGDVSAYSQAGSGTAYSNATYKESNLSISPSFGLAIARNLVLGLDLGASYSSATNNSNLKSNTYQAGVFLRKYKPLGNKFYFFTETELQYAYFDQTQDQSEEQRQDEKNNSINLGFSPGVAYGLNHHWQLEVEFPNVVAASYEHDKEVFNIPTQGGPTSYETQELSHSLSFNTDLSTGFQLQVGVRYLIGS